VDHVRFVPRDRKPLAPPTPADVRVLGDVGLEASLTVSVGGVGFLFERVPDSDDWTGGDALTLGRGTEIDEGWLAAARKLATDALKREMAASEESGDAFETVRCSECGRVLSAPQLDEAGKLRGIECGPAHELRFERGQVLVVNPDGTAAWKR
jgi:hypothetical protein